MNLNTQKEVDIYNSVGGGAEGERVVTLYRAYLEQHKAYIKALQTDNGRQRFLPRNEKPTATQRIMEDDYND